jgi:hypothetical protein
VVKKKVEKGNKLGFFQTFVTQTASLSVIERAFGRPVSFAGLQRAPSVFHVVQWLLQARVQRD